MPDDFQQRYDASIAAGYTPVEIANHLGQTYLGHVANGVPPAAAAAQMGVSDHNSIVSHVGQYVSAATEAIKNLPGEVSDAFKQTALAGLDAYNRALTGEMMKEPMGGWKTLSTLMGPAMAGVAAGVPSAVEGVGATSVPYVDAALDKAFAAITSRPVVALESGTGGNPASRAIEFAVPHSPVMTIIEGPQAGQTFNPATGA